jgi:hypothetical protein
MCGVGLVRLTAGGLAPLQAAASKGWLGGLSALHAGIPAPQQAVTGHTAPAEVFVSGVWGMHRQGGAAAASEASLGKPAASASTCCTTRSGCGGLRSSPACAPSWQVRGSAAYSTAASGTESGRGSLEVTVEPLSGEPGLTAAYAARARAPTSPHKAQLCSPQGRPSPPPGPASEGPLEGVSVLSLCRPAAKNAIGRQLLRELAEALDTVGAARGPAREPRNTPAQHLWAHLSIGGTVCVPCCLCGTRAALQPAPHLPSRAPLCPPAAVAAPGAHHSLRVAAQHRARWAGGRPVGRAPLPTRVSQRRLRPAPGHSPCPPAARHV